MDEVESEGENAERPLRSYAAIHLLPVVLLPPVTPHPHEATPSLTSV